MDSVLNNPPSIPKPDRISPPGLDNFSDEPVYNTKAAVHLSGVPAPTLRAWERRYGVLSPERADNTYRLYSERDMVKIRWLREQVERGISIRQAVALLAHLEGRQEVFESGAKEIDEIEKLDPLKVAQEPALEKRNGAAPDLSPGALQQNLLNAFLELDEAAAEQVIAGALAIYGVEELCGGLLGPVLNKLGEKWVQGEILVTTEHFASTIVRSQLHNLLRTAPRTENGPLVLVACAPGENHEIGLLMLTLFMRRQGLRTIYLGQNVPSWDLMETIAQLRPAMVCLSCSVVESLDGLLEVARQISALPPERRPLFSYGGFFFQVHPELVEKLPGYYLGATAGEAVRLVRGKLKVS